MCSSTYICEEFMSHIPLLNMCCVGQLCAAAKKSFLLQPHTIRDDDHFSAFITHKEAASVRRRELSKFLLKEIQTHNMTEAQNITENEIYERLEKYGLEWFETTLTLYSKSLSFFKLSFI